MENKPLTLGSLFDGSGGFPLGGLLAGIVPVWASEIEPFPIRVTTKRLPFMRHYGDVSRMDGGDIEPVDIITFGSPCQDMSIAGKRAGLDGSRSNLFYEAVRIIREMRCATNGKNPRYAVWENVPGAFSSNGGEDFRCVLEALCRLKDEAVSVPAPPGRWTAAGEIVGDGFSLAWRVLDAQHWGVPQRRKRIFLVADFTGGSAGEILFESEGLSGYSAEGFRSWQGTAGNLEAGAGAAGICLNDQGGNRMDVTEDMTCTLRSEAHHPPCVMESAGFCTEHSAKAGGIGFEEETAPTLRAGTIPAAVALENHPADGRIQVQKDGTVQTLTSRMGTGGMNVPLLLKIRSGCEGGGKGPLIQSDKSATLGCNNDQTVFVPYCKGTRPHSKEEGQTWKEADTANTLNAHDIGESRCNELAVRAFGISSKDSNAMKSANPHSGIYEAATSRTLDGNGGNPACNQGGMAVVALEGNGSRPSHKGDGFKESDVMYTLNATEQHGVAQPTFSSSRSSFFTSAEKELAATLVATDYKEPPIINDISAAGFYPQMKAESVCFTREKATALVNGTNPGYHNGVIDCDYIVRRLTPSECARLQGFPDWWCAELSVADPSEDELRFWQEAFEIYRRAMGKSSKPKTEKQLRKWLADPHTDSAEYKLWGNGVALPCVYFVLSGIVWADSRVHKNPSPSL